MSISVRQASLTTLHIKRYEWYRLKWCFLHQRCHHWQSVHLNIALQVRWTIECANVVLVLFKSIQLKIKIAINSVCDKFLLMSSTVLAHCDRRVECNVKLEWFDEHGGHALHEASNGQGGKLAAKPPSWDLVCTSLEEPACNPMNEENQLLVTDEQVEFQK